VNVADLISDHEGIRLYPYYDTVGKLTIGCGRNLTDRGITHEEAMVLFDHDLALVRQSAESFPWYGPLDEVRQAAILDLLFNLGLSRFKLFKHFIAAMCIHDYHVAAEELKDSRWYEQVARRGPRIVGMIRTGEWPSQP
jgi:lysozyme